jgi:hypothetical protein
MRPPAGRDDGPETPRHHTGHTEPIRTPALRHSIDGNHPELREGQEDSALTADLYAPASAAATSGEHADRDDLRAVGSLLGAGLESSGL